jgi:hypothetical protein
MSRDGSGNYLLPLPPVVTGTTIEATWANTTLDDIKAAMTDSLSRTGNGNMSVPIKIVDGAKVTPGVAFGSEASSGLYRAAAEDVRLSVLGVDKMRWTTANGVQIYEGAAWKALFSPPSASDNDTLRYDNATSSWVTNTAVSASATGDVVADGSVTGATGVTIGDGTRTTRKLIFDTGVTNNAYLESNPGTTVLEIGSDAVAFEVRWQTALMFDCNRQGDFTFYGDVDGITSLSCSSIIGSNVQMTSVPTSDPLVANQLYNDTGYVRLSSGSAAEPLLTQSSGTFTPAIMDSSLSASEGQTYNSQIGHYTKTGKLVWFNLIMNVSGLGTLTTSQGVRIGGLPFASSSTTGAGNGTFPVYAAGLATTAGQTIQAKLIAAGDQHFELLWWDATSGCTPTLFTDLGTGALPWTFEVTGTYRVD